MQKKWHIIYTKPKCERKVAALLTKRKIENFCPLNCKQIQASRKSKSLQEPLFDSYVFVHITENEIPFLKLVEGVVSLVYWKGLPAVINQHEVDAIKEFTNNHHNIKLEQTQVNVNDTAKIIDGPLYSLEGNILTIKNKMIKVNLPSLGFMMIAEMSTDTIMGREISFGNKELLLQ